MQHVIEKLRVHSKLQAVIAAADTPLYLAKQQGGNAVGTASLGVQPAEAPSHP